MAENTETKKAGKPEAKAQPNVQAKAGADGEHCQVAKCKQPVRAKGYCRKHFLGWRRGDVGQETPLQNV